MYSPTHFERTRASAGNLPQMFVSFEGPEGAGKTTVIAAIAERFRSAGQDVLTTREPGSGAFGKRVRDLLLHGDDMDPKAELFLFLADRAQHVANTIRPALAEGKLVFCDRYVDSTVVYQCIARGLDRGFVEQANRFATDGLLPDKTVLLDVAPEIGLARVKDKDRMDALPIEFHRKVRAGFLLLAETDPSRWIVINSECPPDEAVERVWIRLIE